MSDEQLAEVLELTKGADSVELKLTVPDSDQRSTVQALGIDPLDVQMRQVFFFDTPDLKLNAQASSFAAAESRTRATTRSSSCGR